MHIRGAQRTVQIKTGCPQGSRSLFAHIQLALVETARAKEMLRGNPCGAALSKNDGGIFINIV